MVSCRGPWLSARRTWCGNDEAVLIASTNAASTPQHGPAKPVATASYEPDQLRRSTYSSSCPPKPTWGAASGSSLVGGAIAIVIAGQCAAEYEYEYHEDQTPPSPPGTPGEESGSDEEVQEQARHDVPQPPPPSPLRALG
ncbi:hypothetical protein OsI_30613 [Oryza sativa Indica Group]|uniref:Uncharacterized protein n=1 Tax=Oryza sativa subsp. indica TaxID=39946 RepID=B8BDR4_ORYSI|nr:hypothetical protein OsI_30613 [Oryza sativa Indica Group]